MIRVGTKVVTTSHFPDGTPLIKFNPIGLGQKVGIEWCYENNEEMVTLMFVTRHLQFHNKWDITLFMPYIPNARQDRVKVNEDVFTLKYFAEFINSLNFAKVVVLDPHSAVSEALFDNIEVLSPKKYIDKALVDIYTQTNNEPLMEFYPDEGAMKRYALGSPLKYAFGIKRRDWGSGKIVGLDVAGDVDDIKGKNIIIVDDISSRGGTFYHSAKKLKELGANKIYLYITHCEKTILEGEIFSSGLIEKVYTTNSIFFGEAQSLAESKGVANKIEVIKL